jgi:hypothetical protein
LHQFARIEMHNEAARLFGHMHQSVAVEAPLVPEHARNVPVDHLEPGPPQRGGKGPGAFAEAQHRSMKPDYRHRPRLRPDRPTILAIAQIGRRFEAGACGAAQAMHEPGVDGQSPHQFSRFPNKAHANLPIALGSPLAGRRGSR